MRIIAPSLTLIALLCMVLLSQPTSAQGRKHIEIKQANSMRNLKRDGVDIRRLIGDVIIVHQGVTMRCDSAYEYSRLNRFDAFGNVVVNQKNSSLYGDVLYYDGNTHIGRVRGQEVRLVDDSVTLITRYIDFNTEDKTGMFFNGGILYNKDSRLSSQRGYYDDNSKRFRFSENVALSNPDILINTDSLEYYTDTELAYFWGPTRIFQEDGFLYSERGWYNDKEGKAFFTLNSFLEHQEYMIFADTLFYDRTAGNAYARNNVTIIDTLNNAYIYGQYATYNELNQAAEVMINPMAYVVSDEVDTLFFRANVFNTRTYPLSYQLADSTTEVKGGGREPKLESLPDSTLLPPPAIDSTINKHETDSTYRVFKALGEVRFYRHDLQGICDSMIYTSIDSTLRLFVDPIVWNEGNQIYADNIDILIKNGDIHRMFLKESAFMGFKEDTSYYNQMKGQKIDFIFTDGALHKIIAMGSAESVYFIRDQDRIVAVNRSMSDQIGIVIKDNEVSTITFSSKPVSNVLPIKKVESEDIFIRGFEWHGEKRPSSKYDIIPEGINLLRYQNTLSKAREYQNNPLYPLEILQDSITDQEEIPRPRGKEEIKKKSNTHPH